MDGEDDAARYEIDRSGRLTEQLPVRNLGP